MSTDLRDIDWETGKPHDPATQYERRIRAARQDFQEQLAKLSAEAHELNARMAHLGLAIGQLDAELARITGKEGE